MLPGLRFLFAAIVLATSLLVFGLGAAALFRAAHEEFASIPARRAPPEPQFAQQPEAPPVLAMVRVEPSAADKAVADSPVPSTPSEPVAASEPPAPAEASPPAEPAKLAAVKTDDPPPAPPKQEAQTVETPAPAQSAEVAPQPPAADPSPASQPAPVSTEAAPAPTEAKVAAVADPPAAPSEPAPAAPAPAMATPEPAPPPSPEAIAAASRIATLGGPEIVVEAPAVPKATEAKKPERNATSKPAHRKERRRIVRAPPVRQAVQQQLDPFGQPILAPLTRR
ncbi:MULTISPECIES: hypothetical protein [unclassified Bradyrhizobium]|uniref:hypothetical protein n=1 Tax=unclassified Bradyrhizobium TaxID=2631580 RepID=UPI001BABF5E8|nr:MULTISPECIES: hypothetical protein [unclassified Bradyrhizobium]MBR1201650.1 hypothetical protein [Bradyrhizobium sp. AUGA SZCCT0124]MBR1311781.1 hypothetical protein [Bradyrhizobium sp. AUGA SZCCT0051]MBR1338599.1 hypothetical protein [Bradyrhizobium sp. AUGA SZCCT0105]MBR1353173.1 hypothetical protein [Bradyrhizobium sp. AUGA SZCCT0045]